MRLLPLQPSAQVSLLSKFCVYKLTKCLPLRLLGGANVHTGMTLGVQFFIIFVFFGLLTLEDWFKAQFLRI